MGLTKITFTGDIMLQKELYNKLNHNDKNCYNEIFSDISEYFKQSDYVVGNLETPIDSSIKECMEDKYRFTSPIEFASALKNAGIDLVSTANNHCLDNGVEGIKKTVQSLDSIGLKHTGIFIKQNKKCIQEINDLKIGFLSYTYGTNAFYNKVYLNKNSDVIVNLFQNQELSNWFIKKLYTSKNIFIRIIRKVCNKLHLFQLNVPIYERNERNKKCSKKLQQEIKSLKKEVDYVIMCMHEGGQYNLTPLKRTKKTVNKLLKNGVDAVIGNHEHVIHEIKIKNNKLISFSLGNFLGINGLLIEPYDKMSNYSVLLNIYLEKNQTKVENVKTTFTIVKVIEENNKIKIKLLYNLINENKDKKEKQLLINDNQKIVSIVTKNKIKIDDIQKEYIIY